MEPRTEKVMFETTRLRITGMVALPGDGYRSRFSDMLNASEAGFIPLTDVVVETLDGHTSHEHPFMAIARRHVVLAGAPSDQPSPPSDTTRRLEAPPA